MGNQQSTQLNISGFAGRYTACSCSEEVSCSIVQPWRVLSWMRLSWRRPDLPTANSNRAYAQDVCMLRCRAQWVIFVQLAVSLLRARQAEQEGCHELCRFWAD